MILYIIQGYSYEEVYVVCVMHDKGAAINLAKKLVKRECEKHKDNIALRSYWFNVLEVETQTIYFPGSGTFASNSETPCIWDEHDELEESQ